MQSVQKVIYLLISFHSISPLKKLNCILRFIYKHVIFYLLFLCFSGIFVHCLAVLCGTPAEESLDLHLVKQKVTDAISIHMVNTEDHLPRMVGENK